VAAQPRRDFEDEIRKNKRWTWVLLVASFALLTLVAAVGSWAFGGGWPGLIVGTGLAVVLTAVAYFSSPSLALGSTGARPAPVSDFVQLHNLVESMAISASIPKPAVYIVDDPAPNAFATGRDYDNAAVAVTTGLLERMSRDELEGVLAHELAHIRNLDIRVMTVAVATAGSIAVITDVFWRIAFWGAVFGGSRRRGGDGDGRGGNPLALLALVFVAVLAPIAAVLLKAAISRRREALADATAVKLTRYPTGLRRALEKLDADSTVVRRTSHATSHLWIESPDDRELGKPGARVNQMFHTHPPLSERIDILRSMEGLPPYQGPEPDVLADLARREALAREEAQARAEAERRRREAASAGSAAGAGSADSTPRPWYASDRPAADSMPQLAEILGEGADPGRAARPDAADAAPTDEQWRDGGRGSGDARTSDLPPPPPPPRPGPR
jgi:heat shock protein HtpX